MKATKNGKIDLCLRGSPELKQLMKERAKARAMNACEYVAELVRQEAYQARMEARCAERNEYDR